MTKWLFKIVYVDMLCSHCRRLFDSIEHILQKHKVHSNAIRYNSTNFTKFVDGKKDFSLNKIKLFLNLGISCTNQVMRWR